MTSLLTNTTNSEDLHTAWISDVHLGHHSTTTEEILASLTEAFPDNAETARLDIIFIVGDLFDRLMNLADEKSIPIRYWMARFLTLCKKHNIKVRALEGTPSHDWRQTQLLVTVNELCGIGCDLVYHRILDIEYFPEWGINVLYIPDEWRTEPDDTWKEVCEKLAQHGLDKVDYVAMHGAFHHQLPPMVHEKCHDVQRYLSITRKYISIGHVHQMSVFERALAQGSLQRLCHGDEGDKGHFRIIDRRGACSDDVITFAINRNAKIYHTIDMRGMEIEEVWRTLDREPDYPVGSHLRIFVALGDAAIGAMASIIRKYPQYVWTMKREKTVRTVREINEILAHKFQPITITADNVVPLLAPRIAQRANTEAIRERCEVLLFRSISHGSNRS